MKVEGLTLGLIAKGIVWDELDLEEYFDERMTGIQWSMFLGSVQEMIEVRLKKMNQLAE